MRLLGDYYIQLDAHTLICVCVPFCSFLRVYADERLIDMVSSAL